VNIVVIDDTGCFGNKITELYSDDERNVYTTWDLG